MDLARLKPLGARAALGALFVLAGFSKLVAPDATAAVFASHGIVDPVVLGAVVGALEIGAGVMLMWGIWQRKVALVLMACVAVLAVVFHSPLALGGVAGRMHVLDLALDVLVIFGLWRVATMAAPPVPAPKAS
ncbi:MAG: DoxX family protein [Myxococcales bacterium]|jgi:uncharacterized membrane protein YphA (DoxX/SURF4 family)|nr:DoxX family protein [Myxococcales bacterium]